MVQLGELLELRSNESSSPSSMRVSLVTSKSNALPIFPEVDAGLFFGVPLFELDVESDVEI